MTTRARRNQSQQVFRIGIIAGIIGILVVVGGFFVYFLVDQGSRQVPLDIPVYPGAEDWGRADRSAYSRSVFYRIQNATPEQVADYYTQKLREFSGNSEDECIRFPSDGNFLEFDAGTEGVAAYQFVCMFDRSYWSASQYTRVVIQPGAFNEDPTLNAQGMTVVEYDQNWNP
ncbi:MAG: hypothetical protein U0694_24360 [Anaerolineae bacterium]